MLARYGPHSSDTVLQRPLPQYKIDDMVRISNYNSTFTKGYEANFTEDLFRISGVIPTSTKLRIMKNMHLSPFKNTDV